MQSSFRLGIYAFAVFASATACMGGGEQASLYQSLTGEAATNSNVTSTSGTSGTSGKSNVASDHIPPISACLSHAPAPRALRRLTQTELNNSVVDIFGGDTSAPQTSDVFNADGATYGFHNLQDNLEVRNNMALVVQTFAETVAAYAAAHISEISTCSTTDTACEKQFIQTFGKKVFRQPLNAAQVAAYQALMATMPDFASGTQAVTSALIQSPYFLYRAEMGVSNNGMFTLTPYEVASELSYMITASMPDATLMAAADNNALGTAAQIQAQAARLMQTPRAHQALDTFFMQWLQVADLNLDARQEGTTALSSSIKSDMQTETQMLVDDVSFSKNGTIANLLTANYSFMNAELASFYQVSGPSGSTFSNVSTTQAQRDLGILGLGGVISAASQATYASPTLRGRMVRMRMLCDSVPSPPPGIPALDASNPNETTRQRFVAHATDASCAACHTLLDPLGYTFGDYDTVGRHRPGNMENNQSVDASGALNVAAGDSGSAVSLSGLSDLITTLSTSQQVGDCMTRHMAMYAFGSVSWSQDACTYNAAATTARSSNYNLQSTWTAITQTPSFTTRVQDP